MACVVWLVLIFTTKKIFFVCLDALRDLETKAEKTDDLSIPILMRNRMPNVEGREKDEKLDIEMRPSEVYNTPSCLATCI